MILHVGRRDRRKGKETKMKRPIKILSGVAGALVAVLAVALCASVASAGGKGSNQVREIKVSQQGGQTVITVVGSARPTFTAFKLSTPKRLVVDLADSQVRGVPSVVEASTKLISGVAVSQYTSGGMPVSRVMVNFRQEAAYRVRARGNDLVITLTGGPGKADEPVEIEMGDPAVDAALARAHAEAAEARQELAKVKGEAAQANDRFDAAKRELSEIEAEAKRYKEQAEQARSDADQARKVLDEARKAAATKERRQARSSAKAEKRAATEVAAMRAEIARAEKLVAAEQAKRQRLEKRLVELKGDLAVADRAKAAAESARRAAEAKADDLKQKARVSSLSASEAEREAETALEEQRRAAVALEKAAAGERAALLKILEQKGRETVEAKQRLTAALNKEKETEDRLASAMKELRRASSEARKAAKARSRVESSTRKELARAEAGRRKAEVAAERAQKRAEIASAAKTSAEREVERIRSEAASKTSKAERRAAARVAEAEQKLARAERARKSAKEKLGGVVDRLKRAVGDVAKAEERAASYEKELKQYKYKDRKAKERLSEMKDELQWAKWRAGRAEEHAQALQKELRSEVRQARKQAESYEKQLAGVKRDAERAGKRASRFAKELEDFKNGNGKAEKRTTSYERKLKKLEDKARRAERRAAGYEQKIDDLSGDAARAAERLATYESQLAEFKDKAASAERRAATYKEEIARARDDAKEYETRIAAYESQLAEVKSEAARAEKEAKHALAAQARAAQEYMRAAESEKAKLLKVLQEKEQEATEAQGRLSQAKQTIAEQEQRVDELAEATTPAPVKSASEPGVGTAAASGSTKLTQEELRLKRLAAMGGKSGEQKRSGKAAAKAEPRAAKRPTITDIEFRSDGDVQKVIVRVSGDVEYSKSTDANGSSVLVFRGVGLGPMLERTLDVTDFGGAIESVSSYRDGDGVKLDVDVGQQARNEVVRKGQSIEWVFTPRRHGKQPSSALAAAKAAPRKGTESRTVAREDDSAYAYPMDRTAAYAVQLKSYGKKKKRYSGRRIDLDFKDADIHNILRLLADVGHVNIVTADDVSGSVTIRMRNVPWDHALDVILQAKHLGMVREGNLIRVAPLATLEKEREMEIARRKQNQALEPLETRLIPVSYAQASELQPRADDLLSDRGKLSVDERTNVIIARDTATNLDQVEALIRNLDTQTPQVLIEGRIVEASSTYAREIGIQWGGDFSASTATANPTGLAFPSTVGVAGGATDSQTPAMGLSPVAGARPNPNFAVNLPASVGTGSGGALGITLGSITNNANLNFRLSALEEEGTLRILSSPKILTLDNREAHIEQGTLIPYSRISAQGIQTSFKEAKLNLTVTPHVTADGSVLLSIKMTRDEPDFNNKGARGDPTILKREAETELLVSDGHTAVIGGIFTRNHGTSYKKVPFFGDIPILGWLFKSRTDSDRRSEMLIFITPRIVNRAESIGQ
jgi:type IV pilus assembly protein PilQ